MDLDSRMMGLIESELISRAGIETGNPQADSPNQQRDRETYRLSDTFSGEAKNEAYALPLKEDLLQIVSTVLKIPKEKIDEKENVTEYGVDSMLVTEIIQQVSALLDAKIVPTIFFEASNLNELSVLLYNRFYTKIAAHYGTLETAPVEAVDKGDSEMPVLPPDDDVWDGEVESWIRQSRSLSAAGFFYANNDATVEPRKEASRHLYEPIAIIAMEGVFPESPTLGLFWENMAQGKDCVREIPQERWNWKDLYGDPNEGPFTRVKWGGFIDDVDKFDASFFKIAPNEAELMDPHHRLFMQCAWSLLESAATKPSSLYGKDIGVYVGVNLPDYAGIIARNSEDIDALLLNGTMHMFCPGRVSFFLKSKGPSQAIDTACSSSLVAIHRAALAL